jgi:hypothetical protein
VVLFVPAAVQPSAAIVVGEAPSPNWRGDPCVLLASRPFRRTAQLVFPGMGEVDAWAEWFRVLDRCNVIGRVLCRSMVWTPGVRLEAERGAREIVERAQGRRLYLIGRRTAEAFGIPADFGDDVDGVVVLPSPNGEGKDETLRRKMEKIGPPALVNYGNCGSLLRCRKTSTTVEA